jgi:pyruvate formate-lyase activating enzyme-like uncharacterized protein
MLSPTTSEAKWKDEPTIIFKYFKDKEDKLVFILLCNSRTKDIISIKTNIKPKKVRKSYLYKS